MGKLLLGCVADDFTGASDAASFLVNSGIPTMLFNGIPSSSSCLKDCLAVVIASKTRDAPADEAVRHTLDALGFLDECGARQFYLKYCSTFDSTPKGNIGPTVDAVMERYDIPYTVLAPALPINKRVVKEGVLYVDGVPLGESHMRHHPLNPMWDSHIANLMKPQGKHPCLVLDAADMRRPKKDILSFVENFAKGGRCYVVPEYVTDEDGHRIVEVFGHLRLLTGGSGILMPLAGHYKKAHGFSDISISESKFARKAIAISGSCSVATKRQIKAYHDSGGAALHVCPSKIMSGKQSIDSVWSFVSKHKDPLIYSAELDGTQENAPKNAAKILEGFFSELGALAFENGYHCIIVAGGETSGAVILALGFDSFHIGKSVAPGVPIMTPANHAHARLILKSGNFGQDDFFIRAFGQQTM